MSVQTAPRNRGATTQAFDTHILAANPFPHVDTGQHAAPDIGPTQLATGPTTCLAG